MNTAFRKKILIIEDNEDVRNVVRIYLSSKGYEISEAGDGDRGLEMALSTEPDLILLDVLLPKTDGIEVLKKIRARQGFDVPVIMMSAVLKTRDIKSEVSNYGVAAFFHKPFQVQELLKKIKEILNQQSVNEALGKEDKTIKKRHKIIVHSDYPASVISHVKESKNTQDLKGELTTFSIPRLMHSIFKRKATGRLRIINGTTEKRIFFQNGYPVYAESSIPEETLGAFLISKNKITPNEHAQVLYQVKMTGKQYGELLLATNIIGPHELFLELEAHLTLKIISSFGWFGGEFSFEACNDWKDDVIIARMKPGRIIIDGILHSCSSRQIVGTGKILKTSFFISNDNFIYNEKDMALSTSEARLLQLALSGLTVEQILDKVSDKHQALKILFAYILMEILFINPNENNKATIKKNNFSINSLQKDDAVSLEVNMIMAEYLKFKTADYFTLLGLNNSATNDEIEKAYTTLLKRYSSSYHEKIKDPHVLEKIEELKQRVLKAYNTLMDPSLKRLYLEKFYHDSPNTMLSSRTKTSRIGTLVSKSEHEIAYEKGFTALREGFFDEAVSWFKKAEQGEPKAKYIAYRLWAQALSTPTYASTAEIEMQNLFKNNTNEALLPYLLGSLCLKAKKINEAQQYFHKALEIDPHHIDSARQLRVLHMRKSETSGLFDILKKNK